MYINVIYKFGCIQIKIMHVILPWHICIPQHVLILLLRTYQHNVTNSLFVTKRLQSHLFERLWKLSYMATLEYNHHHKATWYHISTPSIALCTSNPLTRFLCWKKIFTFKITYENNVNIRIVKFTCCNSLHMGIVQHEYLKFHVEYTILSHSIKVDIPNHSCVATSLNCVSQQSTIQIIFYLLLHPWHEIMVSP